MSATSPGPEASAVLAAMTFMAIGPLAVAALVLIAYPETAHLELEDLNQGVAVSFPTESAGVARRASNAERSLATQ